MYPSRVYQGKRSIKMTIKIIQEWEIIVSIERKLIYPFEDNEDKKEMMRWAKSLEGGRYIQFDFIKNLNCYSYPRNADMFIKNVELKEIEVNSRDTDSRV